METSGNDTGFGAGNFTDGGNGTTQQTGITCTLFDGDQAKCGVIVGIRKALSALSLLGCVFMIGVIWLFKKHVVFVQRLILYLTIAALFSSIGYVVGDVLPDGPLCDFEAFWLSFWDWTVLLWVSCLTINLFLITVKMIRTDRYEILYHVICWTSALLISLLPLIGDQYGPSGAWCWIKEESTVWRFSIWYGPLFLIIIAMFVLYCYIVFTLNKKVRSWQGCYEPEIERNRQILKVEIRPLLAYPVIYLALCVCPLINRIQNAVNPGHPIFALFILHAMSSPLQGLVNAVVYGMDQETRSRLSWAQIKMSFVNRVTGEAKIKEYSPPAPDGANPNPTPQGHHGNGQNDAAFEVHINPGAEMEDAKQMEDVIIEEDGP